jgi:hypothetical protein
MRDWYFPSWAVLKEPMASAGPLEGAMGGGASLWMAGDIVEKRELG